MKIVINTLGTHGDLQPYIALALGLREAGHTVRILTHQIFAAFVKEYGLDFYPLQLDPRQVLLNQAMSELGNNTLRINRWMRENFAPALRDIFTATLRADRDTDLILNSGLSVAGWHVAEKLGIPAVAAYLWPVTPSRHLPPSTGAIPPAWLPFRETVNYLSTKLSNQLFFGLLQSLVNQCRKEILALRPQKAWENWALDSPDSATLLLYGFSPAVIPRPPDWGRSQHVTGYWFLEAPERDRPERALLDFLASGLPPVYVGFGSTVDRDQDAVSQMVIDALSQTGQRGIVLAGWSGLGAGNLPHSIYRVEAVSHEWLFPHVAAVIHHGGAGTTAAGLRAGVPNVVVPSFGDQFFWGWRVQELGVGPQPIPRNKLTTTRLAAAIQRAISDETMRTRAARLGEQIRAEAGVEAAVTLIEAYARERGI
jgi:sterol 3beta-glucosyltransferase